MIELPIIYAAEAYGEKPKEKFWRSLGHLRQDPAFRQVAQHEFMPGAGDPPGGASRRQFLQIMGASMALAGLTACRRPVEKILPYTRKPEEIIPGLPLFYATAMPFRGVVRGLLVESHEGRPTKVEGNPDHPDSRGATSLFEQASLLNLYDPDRSKAVLRDESTATWQDFVEFCRQYARTGGARRLAVLSEETSSPTVAGLRETLRQRYPQLRWVTYRSEGDDPQRLGMQRAFGRPLRPLYRFTEARVIVSLDADFLSPTDPAMLHNTRAFAQSRRMESPQDELNRLYVVESGHSLTGAMADNRLRLRASDIPAFAAALAARLGVGDTGDAGLAFASNPYVVEIARDLQAAGSRGLVLAGETQPPAVHALCAALNSALGSIGQTVALLDTGAEAEPPTSEALAALVEDMRRGAVDALLIVGANPVYDAPAELDFAAALQQVPDTIHLGRYVDETAAACRWHLPRAHYLEAWGDGRSYDGTMTIIQPLIAPLYDAAKSEVEVLNALATGLDVAGYDLVRERWRGVLPGTFEQRWRRLLHDGFLPDSGYAAAAPAAASANLGAFPASSAEALEVVFQLDPKALDGRYANNAWMQELPHPITKIVWDNVAVMSPATAEALGLSVEYSEGKYYVDVITLTVNGRSRELPVWVMPGYADNSITVALGYGREIASGREPRSARFFDTESETDIYGQGPLANAVGTNVGPLRSLAMEHVAVGAQVQRTGRTYMIATTQEHGTLDVEARPLVRMATVEEYRANPNFAEEAVEKLPGGEDWEEYPMLWEEDHPFDQPSNKDNPYFRNQWGMVIDLNACTGCNACVVACYSENNIQMAGKEQVSRGREMQWIRLDRYFVSDEEGAADPKMVFQPVLCMHCENAPCEPVCPVAATVHSPDGTNQMIYNRCIGTRYCSNNCPYKVRRYNWFNWSKTMPATVQMAMNPNVTVRFRGVMEKCTFCIQRIRGAQRRATVEQRSLRDGEVLTACQQVCPAQAITFGDLNNPDSAVVREKQNGRRYEMLEQLNVKPRTSYLARIRNPNPRLVEA